MKNRSNEKSPQSILPPNTQVGSTSSKSIQTDLFNFWIALKKCDKENI